MTIGLHSLSYNVKLLSITKRRTNTNAVYFDSKMYAITLMLFLGEMWPMF